MAQDGDSERGRRESGEIYHPPLSPLSTAGAPYLRLSPDSTLIMDILGELRFEPQDVVALTLGLSQISWLSRKDAYDFYRVGVMSMDEAPLWLSKAEAAKVIKEIAQDADRVVPVDHGRRRTRERGITITQAVRVARAGYIDGDPWLDEHGNWRVTMRGRAAGEEITVGLAIEWRKRLLITTVF